MQVVYKDQYNPADTLTYDINHDSQRVTATLNGESDSWSLAGVGLGVSRAVTTTLPELCLLKVRRDESDITVTLLRFTDTPPGEDDG